MAFSTVDDLRADALYLAGEPTDSTSTYYASKVIDYLNVVLKALVSGGKLGTADNSAISIEAKDWWWARKHPRGYIRLVAGFNTDEAKTATLTLASTTVSWDAMTAGLSLVDYRLIVPSTATSGATEPAWTAFITAHTAGATSMTIDRAYPYANTASTAVFAVLTDYELPADFLRFASGMFPTGREPGTALNLVASTELELAYPITEIQEGVPICACMAGYDATNSKSRLRFSHYVDDPLDLEFDYIFTPSALTAGSGKPIFPDAHRRVLSTGAAFMILLDKEDSSAATRLQEFQSYFAAMEAEHDAQTTVGAPDAGKIFPRRKWSERNRLLRDKTGRVIW